MDRGSAFSAGLFTFVLHDLFPRSASDHCNRCRGDVLWPGGGQAGNCRDNRGIDRATERRSSPRDDSKREQSKNNRDHFSDPGICDFISWCERCGWTTPNFAKHNLGSGAKARSRHMGLCSPAIRLTGNDPGGGLSIARIIGPERTCLHAGPTDWHVRDARLYLGYGYLFGSYHGPVCNDL